MIVEGGADLFHRGLRFVGRTALPIFFVLASAALGQVAPAEPEPYSDLVEANRRFAFKFLRETVARAPDKNVLVSPTALSLDFALLQNAADDSTRSQIDSVFEFGTLSGEAINKQSLALRQALNYSPPKAHPKVHRRENSLSPAPVCCTLPPERLTLAGSLWAQPDVSFRPKFLETNRAFYKFRTSSVSDRGALGLKAVNDWIAQQTGGNLQNALPSWEKDDFLLIDATSFRGAWFVPFPESATHPGEFKLLRNGKKEVPMMVRDGHFSYLRGPDFQAVRLNYYHASMYIFLPDENSSLKQFEQSLASENFSTWVRDMSDRAGHLELPKFQVEFRANVTDSLRSMGLNDAFTTLSSFAPLVSNPEGAKLTRVLQVIWLQVDEKGTEVVSSSVIGGVVGGISATPPPPPFRMIVDHPFFFAICDQQTNAILYMGAINDPLPLPPAH
jgi:serine protease inhibitor